MNILANNNVMSPAFIYSRSNKISRSDLKKQAPAKKKSGRKTIDKTKNQSTSYLLYIFSAVLTTLYLYSRIITLQVPLSRDEGAYAYLGRLAMNGKIPYRDFYEMKPPLLYYLYGTGGFLFGYSDTGLRLFALFLNLATAFIIYKTCRKIFNKPVSFFASSTYLILLINAAAFGFAMISEHLVNLFLAAAFLVLLNRNYKYNVFVSGFIFGLALMIKQSALIIAAPAFLYIVFQAWKERDKVNFYKPILFFGAAYLTVVILAVLALNVSGALKEAVYWLWTHPSQYASSVESKNILGYFINSINALYSQSPVLLSIFVISLLWSAGRFLKSKKLIDGFLVLLFGFSFLTVFPGFRFYGQYWQLVFPSAAILIASMWNALENSGYFSGIKIKFITWALAIVITYDIVSHSVYFKTKEIDLIVRQAYSENPFIEIKKLSNLLGERLLPEDKIFVFGSEPQVYVYTKKNAISKHFYHTFLSNNNAENKAREQECIADFNREKPKYAVLNLFPISWMFKENSSQFVYTNAFKILEKAYEKILVYDFNSKQIIDGANAKKFDTYSGSAVIVYQLKSNEKQVNKTIPD